jgi:hypothetical protein
MTQSNNNIECPNCGHKIDVQDILYHQVDESLKKHYAEELAKKESFYREQQETLETQKQMLVAEKKQQDYFFAQRIEAEKKAIHSQLKKQLEDEQSTRLQALEQELLQKSEQVKDFNKAKADVARLEREKLEQKTAIEAELNLRFNQQLQTEQTALRQKLTLELQNELSAQLTTLQQEIAEKSNQLKEFNKAKADVARLEREKEEQKAAIEMRLQQGFAEQLKQQQTQLRSQLTQELEEQQASRLSALEAELSAKSNQLKEFNKAKADIMRLEREKDELRDLVVLEKEREFSEKLKDEKLKIQKQADETNHFKIRELQAQLEQQKQLAEEMQRKAEQGSMQLQGEVQELAIEEWLRDHFRLDEIEEIKKGSRGADCLQIVKNHYGHVCGTIYYESKRTKNFQNDWLEKFKNDIREKNATLGVLVTEAMPSDMERMGLKETVWICTFEEFKGLSAVLRQSVIQLGEAKLSQENKGEKMQILYDYLTSNEFRLQVEGIVEGFNQMRQDLEKEKRAMTSIWKQREKQLDKVTLNTINMHGSIRGIAGSAIQPVTLLELSSDDILS